VQSEGFAWHARVVRLMMLLDVVAAALAHAAAFLLRHLGRA
jgi:hypothetical protein